MDNMIDLFEHKMIAHREEERTELSKINPIHETINRINHTRQTTASAHSTTQHTRISDIHQLIHDLDTIDNPQEIGELSLEEQRLLSVNNQDTNDVVQSRIYPTYGYWGGVYVKNLSLELHDFFETVSNDIYAIIQAQHPEVALQRNSTFHCSLFGGTPYRHVNGYKKFFDTTLNKGQHLELVTTRSEEYLQTNEPSFVPMRFEFNPDGSIFARLQLRTNHEVSNATSVNAFQRYIDPNMKEIAWDAANPNRLNTVTSVLMAVDRNQLSPETINKIDAYIRDVNPKLATYGPQTIRILTILKLYNQRTLSLFTHAFVHHHAHKATSDIHNDKITPWFDTDFSSELKYAQLYREIHRTQLEDALEDVRTLRRSSS